MYKSSEPLVSIITPSFNQGQFIEEMIISVQSQDYPHIEHIIFDGGSTDGTLEILKKYPHLRWVSEPDKGQSDALNKGFREAKGEIIGWMNADDYYLPGAVREAVTALREEPEAGMVYANFVEIDEAGQKIRRIKPPAWTLEDEINRGNVIATATLFMRRHLLEKVGFLDEKYHFAMDYDLFIKMWKEAPAIYRDADWATFRLHEASKTVSLEDKFWPEVREISRKHGGLFFSEIWFRHHLRNYPALVVLYLKLKRGWRLLRGGNIKSFLQKLLKNLRPGSLR
jgi:glycosyltransferase involved in cell wall biosynthesis